MTVTIPGLQLGAPGVYPAPELPDRSLRPVRLDVAGFAGVAPRGPIDTPTLVRSWSDYQLQFGGFEGAGRLPYAVSVFFEQGGERAYVVRVGRPGQRRTPEDDDDRALLELDLPHAAKSVRFAAANPGTWGNELSVTLEFDATPGFPVQTPPDAGEAPTRREICLPDGIAVPAGSLLRVRGPGLPPLGDFRWVGSIGLRDLALGRRVRVAVLDRPLPPENPDGELPTAAVVTATLLVTDGDATFPRSERFAGLGLDPGHPEPIAVRVRRSSLLVCPVGSWTEHRIPAPDPLLMPVSSRRPRNGRDIDEFVTGTSFFDDRPDLDPDQELDVDPDIAVPPADDVHRLRGATGLARIREIGLLVVPDLFWNWLDWTPPSDVEPAVGGAGFQACIPPLPSTDYQGQARAARLDGGTPSELAEIVLRQSMLVALADRHERFVALLDVPQRLDARGIARWRAAFDSSYAAAYHPWLSVLRTETGAGSPRSRRELVPPSAFAAGIVAARERRLGLPWGPANELAAGAVIATATVSAAEHDVLHPLGINVFRIERDGFRLTAARTLSRNAFVRQLSVRRLLIMLRLALDRQMQWVVFEPNTPALRELLRHTLLTFLRQLYRLGAFAGDTEEEAFFVRVDDDLNPQASVDLGRLVVEIGVAPAEPIEFIVLRITREGDGSVRVEERATNG